MDNNDTIRRIRYIFDINDTKMIHLFADGNITATRAQISNWLKKDIDPDYVALTDFQLAVFLNGLIVYNRGKQEGKPIVPESKLNNNLILRKLKIALNLKDIDILEILKTTDVNISKHELSAFFRNPKQSQYRECKDQILRNFLRGLQLKYRNINNAENK